MNLESLANELFLDLFEFLNSFDLFRAFQGLNSRFDTLLFGHLRVYYLDFRSASKTDFDLTFQEHVPLIVDQISSIRLSDDDDTPGLIDRFFSHHLGLRQFTYLRSLSLCHIHSLQTIKKIMDELPCLRQLTHLNFTKCSFQRLETGFHGIINHIWSLRSLENCHLGITCHGSETIFPAPTVISSSLKHLSFEDLYCDLNGFAHTFENTPHLEYLKAVVIDKPSDLEFESPILSLTKLNLSVQCSLHILINLLKNLPNLYHLRIQTWRIDIDGYGWEEIITNYFPKLKIFQFKMVIDVDHDQKENKADELLESFRNQFWLEERRLYVRCHWFPQPIYTIMHFYTLPYVFTAFNYIVGYLSKSTCPDDDDYWSYHRVHTLTYAHHLSYKHSSLHNIHFSNIRHLLLSRPFDKQFSSVFPTLYRLISLEISLYNNRHSQLQTLFDRAPRLYSLSITFWGIPSVLQTDYTSMSIRRLDFQGYEKNYKRKTWLNDEQCAILSDSSLGKQCEVLTIRVKTRRNILDIVNTMTKLRALNVKCEEDIANRMFDSASTDDELITWLRACLPSTCTITRERSKRIRLWIR